MLSFIQRYFRGFCLLLAALLGLSLGHLAATALGVYLSPPVPRLDALAQVQPPPVRRHALSEYEPILQRNIFDSTARNVPSPPTAEKPKPVQTKPATRRSDLTLVGTVAAGENSLALIEVNRKLASFRLEEELPGGGKVEEIARNEVTVRHADGSVEILPLYEEEGGKEKTPARDRTARVAPTEDANGVVKPVGENRWVIPREEADKARTNIGELLKQARMEPNIVNGQTEGFLVRMIRPRSFLSMLGIQRGDVVKEINGVKLNSPEQALQIFQQLREAKHLTIGLQRAGQNLNFEYEVQ